MYNIHLHLCHLAVHQHLFRILSCPSSRTLKMYINKRSHLKPRFTWHLTVGAGGCISRRTGTLLGGNTASYRMQHQYNGVNQCWVRTDQPSGGIRRWGNKLLLIYYLYHFKNSVIQMDRT